MRSAKCGWLSSTGGTGKSVTAVNLAFHLATPSHQVLLIDADDLPCASASFGLLDPVPAMWDWLIFGRFQPVHVRWNMDLLRNNLLDANWIAQPHIINHRLSDLAGQPGIQVPKWKAKSRLCL